MSSDDRQLTAIVESFLEQLKALMEERDISQAELARRMARPESYVSKILRGESNLTPPTMERIAKALGVEVSIELNDPKGEGEGAGSNDEATKIKKVQKAAEASPAAPLTRRQEVREKALAVFQKLAPEVIAELVRLAPDPDNPVGRPRGPVYNYKPHLRKMASLRVSEEAKSEREAARLTVEWAQERKLVIVSPGTLRKYFRLDRDLLLERARAEVSMRRTQQEPPEAPEGRQPRRVSDRASRSEGLRDAAPFRFSTPLSRNAWVTRELTRIQDRFRLSAQVMASLQTPYVLEEIRTMAASLSSFGDLQWSSEFVQIKLEELRSLPEQVARSVSELSGAVPEKTFSELAAERAALERAMEIAVEGTALALEAAQGSPSFDNVLWRFKHLGHLMQ